MRGAALALVAFGVSIAPLAAIADVQSRARLTIDAVCADMSERALRNPAVRVARIVADPTTTSPAWRRPSVAMLERIAHDPNVYSEVADVWSDGAAIAIVNVESRSLEFREDASYCFRSDGSLARVTSTSSGTLNIDDEARYYDRHGAIVARTSRLALLNPSPRATVSPDLRAAEPTIFLTAKTLPFFALARSSAQRP